LPFQYATWALSWVSNPRSVKAAQAQSEFQYVAMPEILVCLLYYSNPIKRRQAIGESHG
jgi:hypothetical protein